MYRAGAPADNATMESIIGWMKEELFNDFSIKESDDPVELIERYIKNFNEERPAYSLDYLTPKQYKEMFFNGHKSRTK